MLLDRKSRSPFAEANGRACLGTALILVGDPQSALDLLEGFSAPLLPLTHLYGLGAQALASALLGDGASGERAATDALTLARERGLESTTPGGAVALALGVAMARQGRVEEAEPWLDHALRYLGVPAGTLLRAHALLRLAAVSAALGKVERARTLTREASTILSISPDPGALPELLHEVERALDLRSKRRLAAGDAPSEAEMRVLRLLAGTLSRSEIARALFLSPNTVKTHVGAINRKLGTSTRAETVARARELGLV